jgi:hypothetical protein
MDYLQKALGSFNIGKHQWYGWKKDYTGDTRMSYENIILNDDTATIPSEADVNAKIQELKDAEQAAIDKKSSAKTKLKALGLDDAELKTLGL